MIFLQSLHEFDDRKRLIKTLGIKGIAVSSGIW